VRRWAYQRAAGKRGPYMRHRQGGGADVEPPRPRHPPAAAAELDYALDALIPPLKKA
jgi:hypothetical protein